MQQRCRLRRHERDRTREQPRRRPVIVRLRGVPIIGTIVNHRFPRDSRQRIDCHRLLRRDEREPRYGRPGRTAPAQHLDPELIGMRGEIEEHVTALAHGGIADDCRTGSGCAVRWGMRRECQVRRAGRPRNGREQPGGSLLLSLQLERGGIGIGQRRQDRREIEIRCRATPRCAGPMRLPPTQWRTARGPLRTSAFARASDHRSLRVRRGRDDCGTLTASAAAEGRQPIGESEDETASVGSQRTVDICLDARLEQQLDDTVHIATNVPHPAARRRSSEFKAARVPEHLMDRRRRIPKSEALGEVTRDLSRYDDRPGRRRRSPGERQWLKRRERRASALCQHSINAPLPDALPPSLLRLSRWRRPTRSSRAVRFPPATSADRHDAIEKRRDRRRIMGKR